MFVSNFSHFTHLHQNRIHGGHLVVFNCYLLPNIVGWSGNLVEGIRAAWRFRNAKNASNHICSRTVSLFELKLDGVGEGGGAGGAALGCYGNSELLKSFCSNIQDGRHLEILQTTSPPKQ